jgi:hypothetical protein
MARSHFGAGQLPREGVKRTTAPSQFPRPYAWPGGSWHRQSSRPLTLRAPGLDVCRQLVPDEQQRRPLLNDLSGHWL